MLFAYFLLVFNCLCITMAVTNISIHGIQPYHYASIPSSILFIIVTLFFIFKKK